MPFFAIDRESTCIQACPDYSINLLFALVQIWPFLSHVLTVLQTKLNAFFLQHQISTKGQTFQITIDDTVRHMEDKVKNLGVILDSHLSFPGYS